MGRVTLGHPFLRKTSDAEEFTGRAQSALGSMGWRLWRGMRESSAVVDPNNPHNAVPFVALTAEAINALTRYTARAAFLTGRMYADRADRATYALIPQRGCRQNGDTVRIAVEPIRPLLVLVDTEWKGIMLRSEVFHRAPHRINAKHRALIKDVSAKGDAVWKIITALLGLETPVQAILHDDANHGALTMPSAASLVRDFSRSDDMVGTLINKLPNCKVDTLSQ